MLRPPGWIASVKNIWLDGANGTGTCPMSLWWGPTHENIGCITYNSFHFGIKRKHLEREYFIVINAKKVHLFEIMKRILPCPHCDYKTTRKSNLKTHIRSIHEGHKFPCTYCEYRATTNGSLLTHIKSVHKGVKYPCPDCEYMATWTGDLQKHVNSVHKGVRFLCDDCEYTTTWKHHINSWRSHIVNTELLPMEVSWHTSNQFTKV